MSGQPDPRQEVIVRRCTVEVVRHGGWSWGSDPDLLTRRVLDALPDLLAAELDGLPDGDEDVEITEPVTLDVRVRLPDLLAGSPGRITATATATATAGPGRRVADVVGRMPARSPVPSARPATDGPAVLPAADQDVDPQSAAALPTGPSILEFVAELAARRKLAALLGLLPQPGRDGVLAGLAQAVGAAEPDVALPALMLTLANSGELVALLDLLPTPTLVVWRELWASRAVPATAGGTGEFDGPADDPATVTAALDAALARRPAEARIGRARPDGRSAPSDPSWSGASVAPAVQGQQLPVAGPRAPDHSHREPGPAAAAPVVAALAAGYRTRGQVEVESVLPFLVAGPLARLGVLDALTPALASTCPGDQKRLLAETKLLAAALAYTVLSPLHRGWLRAPEARVAAAAFADLDEVPDEAVAAMAHRVADAAPVLDAVVALALCRGHDPGRPLLLNRVSESAGGGFLLTDPEGLFPIGWTDDPDLVVRLWSACGRPVVLLGAAPGPDAVIGAVEPERIRGFATAGMPFATDLPPARGEPWQRLPGRGFWTFPDLSGAPGPGPVTQLALIPGQLLRLDEMIRALAVSRRAAPLAPGTGLARTLPLTAALGLGTISWLLWKERGATDPLVTLDRLADLSGVVRYGRDQVAVMVPLGRRHADLLRHGLLADLPTVPWLHGRTLTFSGG